MQIYDSPAHFTADRLCPRGPTRDLGSVRPEQPGGGICSERLYDSGQQVSHTGSIVTQHILLRSHLGENGSVFSQPAPFTLGNVGGYLSDLRTERANNTDLSLFKEFFPRESLRVQFRAEFLNAFNRVLFSGPNTSVTSTSFGVIGSQANSPRQLQFGLKILF
jgi:hypothetical protein